MSLEVKVALTATGIFFLTVLVTGVWKYRWAMWVRHMFLAPLRPLVY